MSFNLGILVFDQVEVLDFTGPYEVFTTAARVHARLHGQSPPIFNVFTLAEQPIVRARAGLKFLPDFNLTDHPLVNILIIPGGVVSAQMQRAPVIEWIANTTRKAVLTASVCTGAFLLAQAGVLSPELPVTTHWEDIEDLQQQFPRLRVAENIRWIDTGAVITSAGISAGIDMSLHIVARLAGQDLALKTARQMEFDWQPEP